MKNDDASVRVRQAVADNIRMLRNECGHNQAKFAEMINVNRSYLNQIELGKENVSLDILVKIADGLDRPIVDLFYGLENHPPHKLTGKTIHEAVTKEDADRTLVRYRFSELPPFN